MSTVLEYFSGWSQVRVRAAALGLALCAGISQAAQTPAAHISVRRPDRLHPAARLVVEGGAPGMRALFYWSFAGVAEQKASPGLWRRAGGPELRGRPLRSVACDELGRASLELSPADLASGASVQALLFSPEGGLNCARATPSLTLVRLDEESNTAAVGRVIITEFLKDPTLVSDTAGEWVEFFNPGSAPVDIAGWVLSDLGSESTVLTNGGQRLVVPPHKHIVLARNSDPATNGGVPVDYTYTSFSLSNGDDEIQLTRPDGSLADFVAYDDGILWPDLAGRSISLDPFYRDELLNNDPANWCHSMQRLQHGSPDTGTPGRRNEDCP